jgi:hypothetical protein
MIRWLKKKKIKPKIRLVENQKLGTTGNAYRQQVVEISTEQLQNCDIC